MTEIFRAEPDTTSLVSEMTALNPINPFYTLQYIAFRRAQGLTPWILIDRDNTGSKVCCPAFMKTGRLRCALEIPSMPAVHANASFWRGLMDFCRQEGVSDLSVSSFCSPGGAIPRLNRERSRKARWEYVLDLKHPGTLMKMRSGHAYSVKRARKTGVEMRRVRDREGIETHARLIGVSMQRRKDRGEDVTTSVETNNLSRLIESGTGEIFQAVLDGQVISSNAILIADKAGYNHTQGTNSRGMVCGAAHFLIHEIACTLRDEGKEVFNLGGTDDPDPESGLRKFKTGFGPGTEKIELESATFELGNLGTSLLRRAMVSYGGRTKRTQGRKFD